MRANRGAKDPSFLAPVGLVQKLWRSRELLLNLTEKEIRIRYKQSLLGIGWALFVPVAMMTIFTLVFRKVAPIRLGETDATGAPMPYSVFAYCGLLPWTFFAQSLTGSVTTLITNRQLVTKIYFPREVFPIAKILACFVDLLVASVVLAVLMAWHSIPVRLTIAIVPLLLLTQVLFTAGCALLLSMANLFYRDVQYLYSVMIQLWMFGTAVIYPIRGTNFSPKILWLLRLNPMTPIIDGYRDAILYGRLPALTPALPALAVVILVFWLGAWSFDRLQYLFAERI